jgi:hypothetical protein
VEWRYRNTATDADGRFQLTVPPGPGLVLVKAAEPDFVRTEVGSQVAEGGAGGTPYFPDGFVPLRLNPGDAPPDFAVKLRRGVTFRGGVLSSDGTPVPAAMLFTPKYLPDGAEFKGRHLVVRSGRFELPGCEPGATIGVWVYDPERKEGGRAEFVVGAGGDPTLKLAPCVTGTVKVVDRAGKPARRSHLSFDLVLRPGEDANRSALNGTPAAIGVPYTSLYSWELQPNDEGHEGTFPLRDLIPGAMYAVRALTTSTFSAGLTFTTPLAGALEPITLTVEPPVPLKKPTAPARLQPYVYRPKLEDPEGDPIAFDLVQGPPGMTCDPQTGVLFWQPAPEQAGVHPVAIRASDSYGRTSIQRFQLNIHPVKSN